MLREIGWFSFNELKAIYRRLTMERSDGSRSFFDPKERGHFDVGLSRSLPVAPGEKLLVRSNFAPGRLKNGDLVTVEDCSDVPAYGGQYCCTK